MKNIYILFISLNHCLKRKNVLEVDNIKFFLENIYTIVCIFIFDTVMPFVFWNTGFMEIFRYDGAEEGLWLHCVKYSGPGWSYECPHPDWAILS